MLQFGFLTCRKSDKRTFLQDILLPEWSDRIFHLSLLRWKFSLEDHTNLRPRKKAALAIYLKLKDTFRWVLARGTLHSPIKDISALPERHNLLSPRQQDQCTHTLNALETKGRRSPLLVRMLGPITALWVVECEEICSSCDRLVGTLTPLIYVVEQTRLAAPRRGPVCVRAS